MASLAQHVAGLPCPPLSGASRRRPAAQRRPPSALVCGTYALTKDERERERMRQLFEDAADRCRTAPMDGVAFSPDDLDTAVESTDIDTEIGSLVHSKKRSRLLHGRMSDLVYVKFNSRLKHKRENKAKDPIEKQIVDILEDDDNEFITGVALAADDEQEEPKDPQAEGEKEHEQEVAPGEPEHGNKRKRVVRPRIKKRVKKITDINDGKQSVPEIVAASSYDTGNDDDHDVNVHRQSTTASDQSSQSNSENSISD